MATSTTKTSAPEQIQQAEKEIPLSLDEFCARLSSNDSRIELIGAFASIEARSGTTNDVESAFKARFNDFVNQPA